MLISQSKDQLLTFKSVNVNASKIHHSFDWVFILTLIIITTLSLTLMISVDVGHSHYYQKQLIRFVIGWTAPSWLH